MIYLQTIVLLFAIIVIAISFFCLGIYIMSNNIQVYIEEKYSKTNIFSKISKRCAHFKYEFGKTFLYSILIGFVLTITSFILLWV